MKKYSFFLSLVGCLIFANLAIAIGYDNPRAVWVWAENHRHFVYTDGDGYHRYAGDANIRTYVSYAENFEVFELDWEWGVVFNTYGFEWGESDYYSVYINQAWYKRTMYPAAVKNIWLPAVDCRFGEPTVWGTDCDRVFHQPMWYSNGTYSFDAFDPLNEESTHFHGWYYFGWD